MQNQCETKPCAGGREARIGGTSTLPDNISIARHADTLCCMYLTLAVALLCKETAVVALEMLN